MRSPLARRARALRPDVAFGADLIAGFPTETEAMFGNSLDLVDECGLAFLHVFPYSPRPGTPAARMPQVAAALVKRARRTAARRGRGGARRRSRLSGRREGEVLVERAGIGRAAFYAPVRSTPSRGGPSRRMRLVDGSRARRGRRNERSGGSTQQRSPAPGDHDDARGDGAQTTTIAPDVVPPAGSAARRRAAEPRHRWNTGRAVATRGAPPAARTGARAAGSTGCAPGCRKARRGSPRASTRSSPRRRLDQAALDELEELLIASDMGLGVAGEVVERRCAATASTRRSRPRKSAARLAEQVVRLIEPVMKPLRIDPAKKPFVRPRRRRQRQRQDHDDRQAREALPRRGQAGDARRRRHVPRRRGRAAADLGRARRLPGRRRARRARTPPALPTTRWSRRARRAPTCC